jgi:hypothetical protein
MKLFYIQNGRKIGEVVTAEGTFDMVRGGQPS